MSLEKACKCVLMITPENSEKIKHGLNVQWKKLEMRAID